MEEPSQKYLRHDCIDLPHSLRRGEPSARQSLDAEHWASPPEHHLNPADTSEAATSFDCPFDRLGCHASFTLFGPWLEHSLLHFGEAGPPEIATCGFSCGKRFVFNSPSVNWRSRMKHVEEHYRQGARLSEAKLDIELYRYLWKIQVIDAHTFRNITLGCSTVLTTHQHRPPHKPSVRLSAGVCTQADKRVLSNTTQPIHPDISKLGTPTTLMLAEINRVHEAFQGTESEEKHAIPEACLDGESHQNSRAAKKRKTNASSTQTGSSRPKDLDQKASGNDRSRKSDTENPTSGIRENLNPAEKENFNLPCPYFIHSPDRYMTGKCADPKGFATVHRLK